MGLSVPDGARRLSERPRFSLVGQAMPSNPHILDYGPRAGLRRYLTRRNVTVFALVFATISASVAIGSIRKTDLGWVCAVCGSGMTQTQWSLGLSTEPQVRQSALDLWILHNKGGHSHDWRTIKFTESTLLSGRASNCGTAPPILACSSDFMKYFVNSASHEQLQAFVHVMQTGTDQEQERAVQDAADLVFGTSER